MNNTFSRSAWWYHCWWEFIWICLQDWIRHFSAFACSWRAVEREEHKESGHRSHLGHVPTCWPQLQSGALKRTGRKVPKTITLISKTQKKVQYNDSNRKGTSSMYV